MNQRDRAERLPLAYDRCSRDAPNYPLVRRHRDFEACESFGIDLLEVAEVCRAALAWVEQAAPHLA